MQIARVSPRTDTARLSGAIGGIVRRGEQPVPQAIEAEAIDKAVRGTFRADELPTAEGLEPK